MKVCCLSQKKVIALLFGFSLLIISCSKGETGNVQPTPDPNIKQILFEKIVLVEQYTGTWCGYCPRAISQIDNLLALDKKVTHVALHLRDEMTFNLNNNLFNSFGFTGVPTVHADRSSIWEGSVSTISSMRAPVGVGIGMNASSSAGNITSVINVKFGKAYSESLKLSVYLITDGLIANQANYFNSDPASEFYQKGASLVNFTHRNVLTKIGTDMFGDLISPENVGYNKTYTKSFTFSGITASQMNQMRVVAFVTYASGPNSKKVLNSNSCSVGESKDFIQISN